MKMSKLARSINQSRVGKESNMTSPKPLLSLDQLYTELLKAAYAQGVTLEQVVAVLSFLDGEHERTRRWRARANLGNKTAKFKMQNPLPIWIRSQSNKRL